MANELSWRHSSTGSTVYGTIRSAAWTYWNGSALETLTVANWGDYDIPLAESPASSYFHVGTWPAGLTTPGWYWVDIFEQAGGSPAIDDTLIGTLYGYWNGTKFEPAGGDVAQVAGATQTAGDIIASIAASGPIASAPKVGSDILTGDLVSGAYTDCATLNDIYWIIQGTGAVAASIEFMYATGLAGAIANAVTIYGYYQVAVPTAGKFATVSAWNYLLGAYQLISSTTTRMNGQNGTTRMEYSYPLLAAHIDAAGNAKIKITGNNVATNSRIGVDYAPYYYLALGSSLEDIARAVWQYPIPAADLPDSAAEYLRYIFGPFHGYVTSSADTRHLTIDELPAVADMFNDYDILVHDEDGDVFEVRRIVDMDNAGTLTLDRALSFTPAADDGVRIISGPSVGRLEALLAPTVRTIAAAEDVVIVKDADGNTLATFTKTEPGGLETWTRS